MNTIEFFIPCGLQTQNFTQTPCQIQKVKSKNKQKRFSANFLLWTVQEEFECIITGRYTL